MFKGSMAMRNNERKYEREEMVAYLHGIDPQGNVAHILVHKRGKKVRFSGELGNHDVAVSNTANLEKWVCEAETVWGLADVLGVPRGWTHTLENVEKLELLNISAAKKRKELEISDPI
jgi:hypothetical protein